MKITHKLSIDLLQRESPIEMDAVQNDRGRNLSLMLHGNGIPWTVPENARATVRYCKPDGTGGEYDTLPDGSCAWSAADHILTVALAPQVLTVPGEVALSVLLTDGDHSISTFDIALHVQPDTLGRITKSEAYSNLSCAADALSSIGTGIISGKIGSIVLLGDSITDGVGGSGYNGSNDRGPSTNTDGYCWANAFKKFLAERYGTAVTNMGMCGTQLAQQLAAALPSVTKQDFVIWLTGTNDRDQHTAYRSELRASISALREKCAGVLVISSIPAAKADEKNHSATMQYMDEIITAAAAGYVPYFSMYQAFCRYCEQHEIPLSGCFADSINPNDLGHSIMFKLLCQALGLPLDAYTDYQSDAVWWDPNLSEELLASNLSGFSESSFTSGLTSGIVPCAYMNSYDASGAVTSLSGKHITRMELCVHTAGTITVGTVDLNTVGQQKPAYLQSNTVQVNETGMVSIDVDLDIGANETLAVQSSTDTGQLSFIVGSVTQNDALRFWTSANFESGSEQCIILYGSIYGY